MLVLTEMHMSTCITNKFNGFHIVIMKAETKVRVLLSPIDITSNLLKHCKIKVNSFFSTKNHLAYRTTFNAEKAKTKNKHRNAYQCYYCFMFTYEKINMVDILRLVQEYQDFYKTSIPNTLWPLRRMWDIEMNFLLLFTATLKRQPLQTEVPMPESPNSFQCFALSFLPSIQTWILINSFSNKTYGIA